MNYCNPKWNNNGNLSKGDIIKVVSDREFCTTLIDGVDSEFDVKQGEIHLIEEAQEGNDVILLNPLNDDYLTSNTSRVLKVNPVKLNCSGSIYLENTATEGKGLRVIYGAFFDMNNLYGSRNNDTFLELRHCYSMSVNMKSSNNALSGLGYGVSIVGSNSLLNITGEALGCRHSVAFGGTSTEGGVAWDVHINNFTGSAKYDSQIFDTHYSCGRVHWNNCIGKGRIINT